MTRFVVVSNRVAYPEQSEDRLSGLSSVMRRGLEHRGGTWFGWSGEVAINQRPLSKVRSGNVDYITTDLTQSEYDSYFQRFSEQVLQAFFQLSLADVEFEKSDYACYRRTNSRFADELTKHLGEPEVVWINDLQLIPLGRCLRMRGVDSPIGYFHRASFPDWDMFRALPLCQELLEDFLNYDVIGFQTENDRLSFQYCLMRAFDADISHDGRTVWAKGRKVRVKVMPLGVDADALAQKPVVTTASVDKRTLLVSTARADQRSGMLRTMKGYRQFLEYNDRFRDKVHLLALTPRARRASQIESETDHQVRGFVDQINETYGASGWEPLTSSTMSYSRNQLMSIFKAAKVGLITPMRDGMNLVSKEFVAIQHADDPGVLILSTLAGSALEMPEALLVNPYHTDAIAKALLQALEMTVTERRDRHQALMARLRTFDSETWVSEFITELKNSRYGSGPESTHKDREEFGDKQKKNMVAG